MTVAELRNALATLNSNMKVCVAYPDTASGLDEFECETFDVRAKGVTTSIAGQDEPVFRLEAWSISS
jgi:hypothetical protein